MECCQSFMLDNGAFTAWKQGQPIADWSEYYQWAIHCSHHPGFDFAVIPDVIDGSEKDNDDLIAQWRSVVYHADIGAPVWHMHESLDRLNNLCRNWRCICLGSSGEYATLQTDRWWERMSEAMSIVCDKQGRPKVKLHGLRMLDPAVFSVLPLSSADSTNAVRNGSSISRFGMYVSPNLTTRMAVIADRIEAHNSAAVYRFERQRTRWLLKMDA